MGKVRADIQALYGTRRGNIVMLVFGTLWGLYVILFRSGAVNNLLAIVLLVFGVLGLYNQILGETVVETVRKWL